VKRGSVQLGVETVIVLIIAIVLLGSIIYFIRTFIGSASGEFEGQIERLKERCDADSDTSPILPARYSIKQGTINDISMCVYNNQGATIMNGKMFLLRCLKPNGEEVDPKAALNMSQLSTTMLRGESFLFKPKIDTRKMPESEIGLWTCNVQVSNSTGPVGPGNPGIGPLQIQFDVS
jgi:hypothetical protein